MCNTNRYPCHFLPFPSHSRPVKSNNTLLAAASESGPCNLENTQGVVVRRRAVLGPSAAHHYAGDRSSERELVRVRAGVPYMGNRGGALLRGRGDRRSPCLDRNTVHVAHGLESGTAPVC